MPKKTSKKDYSLYIIGAAVLLIAVVGFSNTGQFLGGGQKTSNIWNTVHHNCIDSDNGDIFTAGTITTYDKHKTITYTSSESMCSYHTTNPTTRADEHYCVGSFGNFRVKSMSPECPLGTTCKSGACISDQKTIGSTAP